MILIGLGVLVLGGVVGVLVLVLYLGAFRPEAPPRLERYEAT